MNIKRGLAKAGGWEFGMFVLQTLFFWWYLDSFQSSVIINVILTIIKTILLFGYNQIWKNISWGK